MVPLVPLSIAIASLAFSPTHSFSFSSLQPLPPLQTRIIARGGPVDRHHRKDVNRQSTKRTPFHVPQRQQAAPTTPAAIVGPLRAKLEIGDDDPTDGENDGVVASESDQALLGAFGLAASLVVLYSESVLFRTGCGLPAGPFGSVGAVEGVSYLGVVGIAGFSAYTKIRTGSGLPSGPGGALGAAEGIAYLAVVAGLLVLVSQLTNYGYIPNAVPMEGGMCQ